MKHRVGELVHPRRKKKKAEGDEPMPIVATFHAYCVQILRRHIKTLGYPERYTIYDRGDQEGLARKVLREIRVTDAALKPGELLWCISSWKNRCIRPAAAVGAAETDKEHLAAVAYRRYQRELKNAGAVDFDDLLLLTEELFSGNVDVRREEAERLDHLLVDEYQDTNGSQYRIVRALASGHRNLCVVGDDDQSIYGWRGAEVEHILGFQRDWPEANVVRLEDNYRSQAEIIHVANQLIEYNATRHGKVLRAARAGGQRPQIWQAESEVKEAQMVIGDIQKKLKAGCDPGDIAILFRTNEQPRMFEQQLRKENLPYVLVGGMSFFDRREVRDVLAYLKVLENPDDEISLRRIINTPPRGIGASSVEQLTAQAVDQGVPLWQVIRDRQQLGSVSEKAASAVHRFVDTLGPFQETLRTTEDKKRKSAGALAELATNLIAKVDYRSEINRQYDQEDDRQSRWEAVEEVVNAIAQYEQKARRPTMKGFLDEITLSGREMDDGKDDRLVGAIMLMTMHSAKGLEFPYVYMVGMEEGLLPHHRSVAADGQAIEEERRLCYVGVTRAQDNLTLSLALTRMKWGKARETIPSRFLFEITGQADKPHDVPPPKGKTKRPRGKPVAGSDTI